MIILSPNIVAAIKKARQFILNTFIDKTTKQTSTQLNKTKATNIEQSMLLKLINIKMIVPFWRGRVPIYDCCRIFWFLRQHGIEIS